MIDGVEFSERSDPPTEFEKGLLLQHREADAVWMTVARRLIEDLGMEQGARALVAVLDEIGGEKVHVPLRNGLFRRLWTATRDEQILRRVIANPRLTSAELGPQYGVSRQYVSWLRGQMKATGTTLAHGAGTGRGHD